jgi:hypothetical protein
MNRPLRTTLCVAALSAVTALSAADRHPHLLFSAEDVPRLREKSRDPALAATRSSLLARADALLTPAPIVPSITKRGDPDPPGETKGIASARALQGRVLTLATAFTLTGERRYRDKAVTLLDDAIANWRIWVDTAHAPPYDLMTGENAMTFGLAFDWLYDSLTTGERLRLREGVERRALQPYLNAVTREKPMSWHTAPHNWNTVCNGGATVLALALRDESALAPRVLERSVPAMELYWQHLGDDGGWDEGTGYWTYGHRYALIAAEALRRSGRPEGEAVFARPGVRQTGYFPIVFNPGRQLSASFGDSNGRASDPIFYLLGREYRNPAFVWFQDRAPLRDLSRDGWPQEALSLLWRPVNEPWLPERHPSFQPELEPNYAFSSIGWGMMAISQPDPPAFLALKNGSLAANHTHLDLNHVSVGVGEKLVLRELGSRPYPADYFGPRRYDYYEIGTAGHNTVLIGGRGQVHRREGRLVGPTSGPGFTTFTGIADGAYDVPTTRARRQVIFVDRGFWVLLDYSETPEPQGIELRFHTDGALENTGDGRWRATDGDASVDILVATTDRLSGRMASAQGWIRPLPVLSLASTSPARSHVVATVLVPRLPGSAAPDQASAFASAGTLELQVGRDRIRVARMQDAWSVQSVALGGGVGPRGR